MKLIVCICQNKYVNAITSELSNKGFRSTKLASSGGFLKKGNTTLLIGINTNQKDQVIQLIEQACNSEDQKRNQNGRKDQRHHRVTLFVIDAFAGAAG